MTISAASASPLQQLLGTISSKASSGSISSTDATALSTAATDVDASLRGDGTTAASKGAARLSPGGIKERVESLIDGEVEKGTLTSDQASTLKELFAQNAPKGAGGPGGAGGPPPGPPPSDGDSDDDTASATSSASSSTSASGDNLADLLRSFLDQLSSGQSEATGYGSAASSSGSRFGAMLVDFQA